MNRDPWYIYGLAARYGNEADDWLGPVVYIGKTDAPARRVREHACDAWQRREAYAAEYDEWVRKWERAFVAGEPHEPQPEDPAPFTQWLAQQWEEFNGPKVIILEEGRGDGWREAERKWIAVARELAIPLFNLTGGG